MKKILLVAFVFIVASIQAQFLRKYESQKVIVENVGQFDNRKYLPLSTQVAYAYDGFSEDYFFTKNGVIISFEKIKSKKEEDERERAKERIKEFYKHGKLITPEEHAAHELKEKKLNIDRDILHTEWINSNPNVTLELSDETALKSGYTFYDKSGKEAHRQLATYKTLTYKNLYPNIDIKYEMHANKGYKYSLIVRPGADLSKVKLRYSKNAQLTSNGTIETASMYGKIVDHAPYSFYEGSKTAIETKYQLQNNEISFAVANYDKTKTLVIDPWTQTPAFNTQWDCVWECEKDAAGNAYLIGGVMPMQLIKYNSAGVQQWVHNTPYDTTSWLGTFAVDDAGNSFVTLGSTARIQRVSTAGVVVWSNTGPGGLFLSTEFWSIAFNCDQSKLVIGGTGGSLPPLPYMYDVNMSNGNITASVQVTGGALFPTQEVRAVTACGNGKYYYLTHDSIGYIHQSLTSCLPPSTRPFHVSSGFSLGYKCENWRVNNTGIEAIAYSDGFIYTHKGNEVQKRDFATAAVIASVAIPGGQFSGGAVRCSGLDVDDCGNVYAGSTTGVVKFNANLVQQATYATTFNVYDVAVSTSGDIIACGSTGTSSSGARQGSIQSFAASACAPIAIVCCDATICPVPPKCITDGPVTLTATTAGGTFSGPGVSGNTFNPATAGVGVHIIRHTIACGVDSITITVNSCSVLNVCKENNGQFTVTGGTAPFTWSVWDSIGRTCSGTILFGNCLGTWTTNYGWRNFGSGTTVTSPVGKDTIRVVDNSGGVYISYNKNLIPPCSSCNLAIQSKSVTQPTCSQSNGAISVTMTGGTLPYTYAWTPNVSTTNAATGLAAGSYRVVITAGVGCTKDTTFTLTGTTAPNINSVTKTDELCQGQSNGTVTAVNTTGGSPTYTYGYSPSSNPLSVMPIISFPVNNLAPGTYIMGVQDVNSCRDTFWFTIGAGPVCCNLAIQSKSVTQPTCSQSNGAISVTMTGGTLPYTYAWTPNVSTTNTATGLAAGSYRVVITAGAGCTKDTTFTLTGTTAPNINSVTKTDELCQGQSNGTVTAVNTTGGSPTYTYGYSPSSNPLSVTPIISFPVNNLAPGTYIMGLQDVNSCRDTFWFTIGAGPVCCNLAIQSKSVTQPTCSQSNGAISVTMTGGTLPYTYAWTPNVSTTNTATGLAAGSYRVVITAGAGCTKDTTFTLTGTTAPNINSVTKTDELCQGQSNGTVTAVNTTGGSPTYTYGYSPSSNPLSVTPIISFPVNNLAPGTYIMGVQDVNSCRDTFWFTIGAGPVCCNLAMSKVLTLPTCGQSNGGIDISPLLGSGNYTYSWSPGGQTTQDVSGLGVGLYTVKLTDVTQGCSIDSVFTLNNLNGPTITNVVKVDETCLGNDNGSIALTASGGTGTLTYTWTPTLPTTASQINLAAGTYSYVVTDSFGCQATGSSTIAVGNNPSVSLTPKNPDCHGSNGEVVALASPSGNYTYLYSNGGNTSTISNIGAGTYTITVTDTKGCTATATSTLTAPTSFTATITAQDVTVFGGNDGSVTLTLSGGNQPIVYIWSNDSISQSISNVKAGVYTVTISDAANCNAVLSAEVKQPLAVDVQIELPTAFTPNNDGINDLYHAVTGPNTQVVEMRIYNRWGEKVYEAEDNSGWDGKYKGQLQAFDTYVVHLSYKKVQGDNKVYQLIGSFAILK
jgi:gliding motility-associated-like protein